MTLVIIWSRVKQCSGWPSQSLQARNFSTIQASRPAGESLRRDADGLGLGALLVGVARLLREAPHGGQIGLLLVGQRAAASDGAPSGHVEVDGGAVLRVERADPGRHLRAPVATLGDVARVAEPGHQRDEGARRCGLVPARRARAARRTRSRAATARPRGRRPPRRRRGLRVGQPGDHVEELDDGARPAVGEEQRAGRPGGPIGRGRSGSSARRCRSVKWRNAFSLASCGAPVVGVVPVPDQLAQVVDGMPYSQPVPSIWSGKRVRSSRSRRSSRTASLSAMWNGSIDSFMGSSRVSVPMVARSGDQARPITSLP